MEVQVLRLFIKVLVKTQHRNSKFHNYTIAIKDAWKPLVPVKCSNRPTCRYGNCDKCVLNCGLFFY